jgi:hypothetical protein
MVGERPQRIIGPIEYVVITGHHGKARVKARIDTGAARTSVDIWLAARIGLGPTVDVAKVRSSLTDEPKKRPVVKGTVEVDGIMFRVPVSIGDRSEMRYPVLIGMDILRSGKFLIDPSKKLTRPKKKAHET